MNNIKNIGDLCTNCHRDTSFGSGLFVNRVPSCTENEDGYLCPECLMLDCDRCEEKIGVDEDIFIETTTERIHQRCLKDSDYQLINEEINKNCDDCSGLGCVESNDQNGKFDVQRCDSCKKFKNDQIAKQEWNRYHLDS